MKNVLRQVGFLPGRSLLFLPVYFAYNLHSSALPSWPIIDHRLPSWIGVTTLTMWIDHKYTSMPMI